MKNILMIIILSLFLFSCGEIEEAEEEETINDLAGTWKTACYSNSDNSTNIDTFTFVGNVLTVKDQRYSGSACATVYKLDEIPVTFSYGNEVTFMSGNTGRYFKLTLGSTFKRKPQSDSAVSAFNSSSECSKSDWALNTEKNVVLVMLQATFIYVYISLMVITGTLNVIIAHILQHQISIPAKRRVVFLNNKFFLSIIVTGST